MQINKFVQELKDGEMSVYNQCTSKIANYVESRFGGMK